MTLLWSASRHGQIEVVDCLIRKNADPNIPSYLHDDKIGKVLDTPLCIASSYGHLMVVKMLLKAKADPNFQLATNHNDIPLICAICADDIQIVDALLEANANPNLRDSIMCTSLHHACLFGNLTIINRILKAKANPNVQNINGLTPLLVMLNGRHAAAGLPELVREKILKGQANIYEVVDILLNADADPDIPDKDNFTPLHAAAEAGRTQCSC